MTSVHPTTDEQSTADEPSDAELITAVRAGNVDAYDLLYRRHLGAARNLAGQLTRSPAELDDLVAEAFAKVLDTLRGGGGPDTAFRAYLLTTLRHSLYDKTRRERRVEYSDDLSRLDPGEPFVDTAVQGLEATLVARAFGSLPERWQTVLWHTEVEGETPAQVAPLLGLTPNGVSALAYRAREGLRQAYLQVHLQDTAGERCRYTVERLGAWARHGLSKRERSQVDAHLAGCERCQALAAELADLNGGLRAIIAPLIVGVPWAAGYLGLAGEKATAAAGAAGAAGTAGAGTAGAGTAGAGTAGAGTAGAGTAGAAGTAAGGAGGAAVGATSAGAAAGVAGETGMTQVAGILAKLMHTPAGQAAVGVASVAAAVAVGIAVLPGVDLPRPSRAPTTQPAVAGASTGPAEPSGAGPGGTSLSDPNSPGGSGSAGGGPVPVPGSGGPGASTTGGPGTSEPGTSGQGTSAAPGSTGAPSTGAPAGPPWLAADPASTPKALVQGLPGVITVTVRNTGTDTVTGLTAYVSLPAGIVLRGSGGIPGSGNVEPSAPPPGTQPTPSTLAPPWLCSRSGAGATCRLTSLAAGGATTIQLRVFVGVSAQPGTLTGTVTADGGVSVPIPASELQVLAG
jgi:RNA polymerase sigma factor (sigma-70 family)